MKIVEAAQKKFERDKSHWSEIYLKAQQDLDFLSDDLYAQWDFRDASKRADSGRPVLTIDQLSQFVHQVVNDIRMNTPSINVIPSGNEATVETAEIFKGLIKNIEYKSQADDAYDMAISNSTRCSIGYITIENQYANDESFEQDLFIKRIVDPFAIYIDCESIEVDGRDAKRGYILEPILVEEFNRRFPGKDAISFGDSKVRRITKDSDYINLCKYYEIEESTQDIMMLADGSIQPYGDEISYKLRRKIKKKVVKCYLLSGADVLEESIFPGEYIPIVPVYGEEMWNQGKRHLHSLIRKSKDAQRMYNYWKSLETELLQKQPQAPVVAAEGQTEDYAEDWKQPDKTMVLRYKTTDAQGNQIPPPQRLEPPMIPAGVVNASRATIEDIKSTMGIYNASLGQRSNETSGIAIARRQEEGSVATFHFADNLNKSIAHVGRILVCAIPQVYDSSRIIQIIDDEEEPKEVGINGQLTDDQQVHYDLTKGKYDVKIVSGASYTTRRQEAAQFFTDLVTKQPQLMEIMGDLLFKNMDFTGAQAMAERMKKLINPKLLDEKQGVDPEKEQMQAALQQSQQALNAMATKMEEMQNELKSKETELMLKAKSEENKTEVDMAKLQIEQLKLQIEQEKLILEAKKLEQESENAKFDREIKLMELVARENAAQMEQEPVYMTEQPEIEEFEDSQ